ncbi:MAG: acyl-ACP--UDP-N-acetylglucosamine O-acyltransferase [Gemmataceae bacterium]|nr:acyl-ACP--UDP-N-acetylglucosamine O-acyltransferase [Gemmataceae bacterium]MDW8266825.1 acyl-ACP--UDP-N-acetylglucosamine O-acyltransferase [Gemmataceae bacterium]
MPISPSARVHPTAIVSPEAELGDGVEVGAMAIIEGPVRIGPRCVLRPRSMICGPLTMGEGNVVFSGAVLGERPQHLRFTDAPTGVWIGDYNIFRENVTVHGGTTYPWSTRIGHHNLFMAGSHVAHDCQIGNRCILANGSLVAGHCVLEDNVYLSGNSAVHQFVRIGRLALLSGCSGTSKDIPPFIVQHGLDNVSGINVVGMRRAGMSPAQINAVRQAFRVIFRQGLSLPAAVDRLESDLGHIDVVAEMIAFLRKSRRGVCPMRDQRRRAA